MGRVLTNAITLSCTVETTPGVLPGSPTWRLIEPNSIGKFGPMLKKIAREPISKNRQRRKGALVDLDSTVEFEADVTFDHLKMFIGGLLFCAAKGNTIFSVSAVTATDYTVASGGAIAAGTLIMARGFANSANNGLKVVGASSTGTAIKATGLVAEATAPTGAVVEICGIQGAAGDMDIDSSGNLTTTTIDWTAGVPALLQVGQFVWIGGDVATALLNFTNTANRGLARVTAKAAGKLTLDKKSAAFVTESNTTSTVQVFWGQFFRNVPTDNADYLETTYQFELAYENLDSTPGSDKYEYATGNFVNEITLDLPLTSKGTMKCGFIGLNTANPTTVRATNASTPIPIIAGTALNTSADFTRMRVTKYDETGITTDFKSITCTIKNNVTAEKVLGLLGGKYMNAGLLDIEISGDVVFTDSSVISSMRDNSTVTMEIGIRNDDGGFILDVPAMTIEGGDKQFPMNQSVSIAMKALAFQDARLGYSASCSTFPYIPLA